MYKRKVVALVGASSTGKTTVFDLLKQDISFKNWEFKNESTRVVNSYGFPINEQGVDVTQLAISNYHLKALLSSRDLVLDRSFLDLIVYTENLEQVSKNAKDYIRYVWKEVRELYTHFVYFPIEFHTVDDGVRSVNEEWRTAIDIAFQQELSKLNTEYLTVSGSPKQRINQINNYIFNNR